MSDPRIAATTKPGDKLLLLWILVTLLLGLSTIALSAGHMDGEVMVSLMTWAQHIVTFRATPPATSPASRRCSRRTCSWGSRCS